VNFPRARYDLYVCGTHYQTQDVDGSSENFPSILIKLRGAGFSEANKAQSHYEISYNNLNIEFGKNYSLSRFIGIRTLLGLKKAWIDQQQKVKYTLASMQTCTVKDICEFSAIGPRVGVDIKIHLFYGLNLSMDFSGFLLYGKFDLKHKEDLFAMQSIDLNGSAHLFSPGFQFFLGVGWNFYPRWGRFGVRLGYETEYYFRQNQTLKMDDTLTSRGRLRISRTADDITFYGGTLKFRLDF